MSRPTWYDRAGCAGMDTELFYPSGTTGLAADQGERARTICVSCPVRTECRTWAIEHGEQGVWGGTNEEDRTRIRRERRRKPPRT